MTANVIPTFQVEQFATNIELLLQQKDFRFGGCVTEGTYVGKQASPVEQVGPIEMNPVTTRFAPITRTDAPTDRRWAFPSDFDLAQMVDNFDQLRLIVDPKSSLVQAAVAAANRKKDDVIYGSFFATAKTGEQGGTSTTPLPANDVSVNTGGSASNLNVAKLRAAKKLLMSYEVDFAADPLFCAISSVENDSLLNEIQVIQAEFNPAFQARIENGEVKSVLGINMVHYERLVTATDDQLGTSKQVPVWCRSGMHLAQWSGLTTKISQRDDLTSQPWQVYTAITLGATRLQEKKIIRIWCR